MTIPYNPPKGVRSPIEDSVFRRVLVGALTEVQGIKAARAAVRLIAAGLLKGDVETSGGRPFRVYALRINPLNVPPELRLHVPQEATPPRTVA